MRRLLFIPLLLVPLSAGAAYPLAQATTTNTYTAASEITVAQPLPADLITAGGTVNVAARVEGDILAVGGTLTVAQGAGGDVRVAGGRVAIHGPVGGDVAAAGGSVQVNGTARTIYAAGGSVDMNASSTGDVRIYGANVALAGEYAGNVTVVASNHFELGEGTHIRGTLTYSAPEQLVVPQTTLIDGGAKYTGAYAYVPTNRQAHQYALLGSGIFFAVRILAGIIVAGLIAGLFPVFSERVSILLVSRDPWRILRLFGIGLAIAIGVPILSLLLLISFVGAELAFLVMVLYVLLALLAYAFCGIVVGLLLRRTLLYRAHGIQEFTWKDAALGTALVHLLSIIPVFGTILLCVLALMCGGALVRFAYREAFEYHPQ